MKIAEFANSVDLGEVAHNEPPHLHLHCLPSLVFEFSNDISWTYIFFLKVGSWSLNGIIILLILFSKLSESTFYKKISDSQ